MHVARPPPTSSPLVTPYRSARAAVTATVASRPLLPAVAGASLIAFSAIWVRLAAVPPTVAAVYRCAYALPFLALLARREGADYDRRLARWAGVCFAADLILWHHAIEQVGAGLATVLGNLQVVVVGLVAWALLGERPPPRMLVAVPVVLFGVVLLSGVLGEGAYGANPPLGALLGVGTAIAYAGFILLLRRATADPTRSAAPLRDATLVAALAAAAITVVQQPAALLPSWPAHGWLAALALGSQVAGWLLISRTLPRLPAVATALVLLLQPVGSVLLGVALLAERPSPLQWLGVVVVVGGVTWASLRPRRGTVSEPVPQA